jgi:hypothetical protein
MTVPRHDLTRFERRPYILLDSIIRRVFANFILHFAQPEEDLLVSETMKGTSETVERGAECEEGIRESRANKLSSVGRDVTTFVVT